MRVVRYGLRFPIWGDEAFVCLNLLDHDLLELAGPLRFDQVAPVLFLWVEWAVMRVSAAEASQTAVGGWISWNRIDTASLVC